MSLAFLIPLALGTIGILQGALNKQLAQTIGVAHATMLGSVITLAFSVLLYIPARYAPHLLPELFQAKLSLLTWKWWYFIPGLFGLFIVAGLPFAFAKLGAVNVTVGLIAAQMITSVLWDLGVEGLAVSWTKWLGLVLAFTSVLLITVIRA